MDDSHLKWLSDLQEHYPLYKSVLLLKRNLTPLYYLYEKQLVDLKPITPPMFGYSSNDEVTLEYVLLTKYNARTHSAKVRLTAKGVDAINSILKELKKQKDFMPPAGSGGKLKSIFKSPVYIELKEIATTFLAKLGNEMSNP